MNSETQRAWQGILLLVVGGICYWLGAFDEILETFGYEPSSTTERQIVENNKTKTFTNLFEIEQGDQRQFSLTIQDTSREAERAPNEAAEKLVWINVNKKLCSNAATFRERKDWRGKVLSINSKDSGEISLTVRISNGIDLRDVDVFSPVKDKILRLSEGSFLKFSGSFVRGDMGENECLESYSFFSEPNLLKKSFKFKFSKTSRLQVSKI